MSLILSYVYLVVFFFFKQKTAYEMRISDWSSDVCSSDLCLHRQIAGDVAVQRLDLLDHRGGDGAAAPRLQPGRAEPAERVGQAGPYRPLHPDRKSVV